MCVCVCVCARYYVTLGKGPQVLTKEKKPQTRENLVRNSSRKPSRQPKIES